MNEIIGFLIYIVSAIIAYTGKAIVSPNRPISCQRATIINKRDFLYQVTFELEEGEIKFFFLQRGQYDLLSILEVGTLNYQDNLFVDFL